MGVVYFIQHADALQTVCWLKSLFWNLTSFLDKVQKNTEKDVKIPKNYYDQQGAYELVKIHNNWKCFAASKINELQIFPFE